MTWQLATLQVYILGNLIYPEFVFFKANFISSIIENSDNYKTYLKCTDLNLPKIVGQKSNYD